MQRIHEILNALAAAFGQELVKGAVRGWIGMKDAEEFLAANPGLRFTNEGVDPCGSVIPAASSGLDAATSGEGESLATTSCYAGGAALCYTPNASGRYSTYSGIPDVDPDVTTAAEALAGLAVASSSGQ